MGPMQALYKGNRLVAILVVGLFVAFLIGPAALGAITGLAGVTLGPKTVAAVSGFAGLYVMGRLA